MTSAASGPCWGPPTIRRNERRNSGSVGRNTFEKGPRGQGSKGPRGTLATAPGVHPAGANGSAGDEDAARLRYPEEAAGSNLFLEASAQLSERRRRQRQACCHRADVVDEGIDGGDAEVVIVVMNL